MSIRQLTYWRAVAMGWLLLLGGMLKGRAQPVAPPSPYSSTPGNYILSWSASAPIQDADDILTRPVTDARQTNQYFDGLGRLLQTVSKQATPQHQDMVAPVVYDAFGREQYRYLPYYTFGTSKK